MNSYKSLVTKINHKIAQQLPYKGRVIDLGCGSCPYKQYILETADEYIGVDWDRSVHDQSEVDIVANLLEHLPFPDSYADTIVSFQVMEHLPEPSFFLSECFRVLKPQGRLFLTVPFMWHVHEAPYDYFRYTRHGLEFLLTKAGFIEIEIRENSGFWQMWILKFAYHTARLGPIGYILAPIWWLGQLIAPILDKYDMHPEETISYTVIARKPIKKESAER